MQWVFKPGGDENYGKTPEVAVYSEDGSYLKGAVWKEGDTYTVFAATLNGPFGQSHIADKDEAIRLLRQTLEA